MNQEFIERNMPGGGTAVTALQTAQHTEVAPTGYIKRFRHPEHTSWLCAPDGQQKDKLSQK